MSTIETLKDGTFEITLSHELGDFARELKRAGELLASADFRPWGGVPVVSPTLVRKFEEAKFRARCDTVEFTGHPESRVCIPRHPQPSLLRELVLLVALERAP